MFIRAIRFYRFAAIASVASIYLVKGYSQPSHLVLTGETKLRVDLRGQRTPKWSGDVLLALQDDNSSGPTIVSLNRQGEIIHKVTFNLSGAAVISVLDFAAADDGLIALTGSAGDPSGRAAFFVAWAFSDGQTVQVIRTSPYVPFHVTLPSDGSIWTAGYEDAVPQPVTAKIVSDTLNPKAMVFRRFDRSGKQIGAFLAQSDIDNPLSLRVTTSAFGAARDRVIWYSSVGRQYIELNNDGVLTKVSGIGLPNGGREFGFAINKNGELFVDSKDKSGWVIAKLDPRSKTWVTLADGHNKNTTSTSSPALMLYGANADTIVAATEVTHMKFFAVEDK